jgi:hypothetical protein
MDDSTQKIIALDTGRSPRVHMADERGEALKSNWYCVQGMSEESPCPGARPTRGRRAFHMRSSARTGGANISSCESTDQYSDFPSLYA